MTILQGYLYSDVVQAGTVTINYPAGFSPDTFDKAGAKACLLSPDSSLPAGSYSLAWGGSSVVVTNNVGTWKGGVSLFVSVPDVTNVALTTIALTQAQYDALAVKDVNTLYVIVV